MVGRRKREMSGIVLNYFYAFGEAAVGLSAWLCRDWVSLQLIVSAPSLIFVFYYWVIPESVRWLLARKETLKAEFIIRKAAQINGVVLSENLLATFRYNNNNTDDDNDNNNKSTDETSDSDSETGQHEILKTFKLIFKSRILLFRCLILFYIWYIFLPENIFEIIYKKKINCRAANAFVYYGLSLNSINLSGNKYVNFALVCLVEIPGYSLAWVCFLFFVIF